MFIVENVKANKISVGDLIKSRNIDLQEDCYREVLAYMIPTVIDQIELNCDDGFSLCTSSTHPIAVFRDNKEQYIETKNVVIGDMVITNNGYAKVKKITKGSYPTDFVDYTIDEHNNYYAGNNKDKLILAHNSATVYYPIWHLEVEDLLVLKNNKGTDDNRVRHMDYGIQFNKLMYERLMTGGDITCFSPNDVPDMYEAFFNDQDKFKELYERAERNTKLRKKTYKAIDLFSRFMQERKDTGRIYLQNVDHANTHSPFKEKVAPIKMSNLCAEIDLPTVPLNDINDENGRISLCTLSAANWGNVKNPHDFERICRLAVRGLDALLSYQDYPIRAARLATEEFRPLGVGIINLAYFLAKHDVSYSDPNALALVDEYAEAWSYYLIKASADLAAEQGPCTRWQDLKYADGVLPIDSRKRDIDELVPYQERMPWAELRAQILETGIRNATLMAAMPAETSAQISNSTNGIEPPRSYVSIKQSKHGVLKQVVPEYRRLKNKYELLWSQKNPEGYLKICAVLQKYIDQGLSVNTSYNPHHYEDDKIPMSEMLKHLVLAYKWGLKQLYYFNTMDGQGEIDVDKMTAATPVKVEQQEEQVDCDSCVI